MRLRQRNSWNQTLLKNCFDWSLFLFSLCSLGFNLWLWRLRGKKCLNLRQISSEKKGRTLSVSLRIYYSTSWAWISNLKKNHQINFGNHLFFLSWHFARKPGLCLGSSCPDNQGWGMASRQDGRNVLWRTSLYNSQMGALHKHEVSLAFKEKHGLDWAAQVSPPKDLCVCLSRRWDAACSAFSVYGEGMQARENRSRHSEGSWKAAGIRHMSLLCA